LKYFLLFSNHILPIHHRSNSLLLFKNTLFYFSYLYMVTAANVTKILWHHSLKLRLFLISIINKHHYNFVTYRRSQSIKYMLSFYTKGKDSFVTRNYCKQRTCWKRHPSREIVSQAFFDQWHKWVVVMEGKKFMTTRRVDLPTLHCINMPILQY
jgi:hypothetical protein